MKYVRVPRRRGRPRTNPKRLIADRGYDSELIRRLLRNQRTEPIISCRRSVKERRHDDGRKLRRYRKRWKAERLIAWLANFRRLGARYNRNILMYQGFLHLACLIITLRQVRNRFYLHE